MNFLLLFNYAMTDSKTFDAADFGPKLAILGDIHCELMLLGKNPRQATITRNQWFREYCEYVFKYCGEAYNLYNVKLIGGSFSDLLTEYQARCPDIHLTECPDNIEQLCEELYRRYGASCHLPPVYILKYTYEALAHHYIETLPYFELVGLGI